MEVRNIDTAAIIMDECGAMPLMTVPEGDDALLVEFGGRRNRTRQRELVQVLMTPEQSAEFVARITHAAGRFGNEQFKREFVAALERERQRTE